MPRVRKIYSLGIPVTLLVLSELVTRIRTSRRLDPSALPTIFISKK
jgi:hypothetical protein